MARCYSRRLACRLLPVSLLMFALFGSVSAEPIRIMAIGDSITAGYTNNPAWSIPFDHGYRSGLYDRLTAANIDFQFVGSSPEPYNNAFGDPTLGGTVPIAHVNDVDASQDGHRGYGGKAVGFLNQNMFGPSGWLANDSPDVILLHIGTNGRDTPGLMTFLNNTLAEAPGTKIIVSKIIPKLNAGPGTNTNPQDWVDYNDFIDQNVAGLSTNISVVDNYSPFLTDPNDPFSYNSSYYATGNHPNADGYDVMAQTFFDGIQAVAIPEPSGMILVFAFLSKAIFRRNRKSLHQ